MSSIISNIFNTMDIHIMYACIIVLAIALICSIIFKIKKLITVIIAFILLINISAPFIKEFQNKYKVGDNTNSKLELRIDNETYSINDIDIQSVEFKKDETGSDRVIIKYKNGVINKKVPSLLKQSIKNYLNSKSIKYSDS